LKPLESDLVSYLTLLRQQMNFKTNRVYASLPAFTPITTLIELPDSRSHNTATLAEAAKSYIPLPITTVTLQYLKVGEKTYPDGTKKQQIFLISIPNERIENYHTIFNQAGFVLEGIEIEQESLSRALAKTTTEPMLIIDIGGRSTSLSIAQNGQLKYAGQTDFSSGSLTQALATALNISERRADTLKRQTLIIGKGGDHELSTIMIPIIDVIIEEANRVRAGFEKGYGKQVKGAIIAGSGANMPGFEKYLSEQLQLPVSAGNALKAVAYQPELESVSKQLGATLATAVGLALKKFS
jgi:type IV pilus assembly protein PilM